MQTRLRKQLFLKYGWTNYTLSPFPHTCWVGKNFARGHCPLAPIERGFFRHVRFFVYKRPSQVHLCILLKIVEFCSKTLCWSGASMQTRQGTTKMLQEMKKLPTSEHALLRMCDMPFCGAMEIATAFGDNSNIKWAECGKFICGVCTQGTMKLQDRIKELPGVQIRTFSCPFCRCSFNEWILDT